MSGSPLASAPPITVTQENGASATVPTPNQTPTYPRTGPTEGARAHCPARMQKQKRRGSHMPVQPMPDPAQTRSTETQTKTIETARVQTAFCTAKPETVANREDPTPNALQEPHAFLAGLNQSADLAQKTARKEECPAINSCARQHTQFTSTDASPAARNGETRKAATGKAPAFLAGPGRTTGQSTWTCEARNERAPAPQRARPPTPSSGSATNSAASPRRAQIRKQLHTLPGCCDGQQPGSSDALRVRLQE